MVDEMSRIEYHNKAAASVSDSRRRTVSEVTALLSTKMYMPPLRTTVVTRPRLMEKLAAGGHCPLTLISAPAGFGKTTLVTEWITGSTPTPESTRHPPPATRNQVAWLSLDEEDDDPTRFWTYFVAALQTIKREVGGALLALLQSPQSPPIKTLLTLLINELSVLAADWVLVLDDYHLITDQSIHEGLAFFIDHLPPAMHLIITTRVDPPLPLARWRARGQLCEVRADELRFTSEEAAAFLNTNAGLNLSAADVATLERRTEGWIVGLRLAALSMQGRSDIAGFLRAFTGTHRYILSYLTEEVLQRQPEYIQHFLLQTAIVDRLCASLCDALLAQGPFADPAEEPTVLHLGWAASLSDSQMILEQLEQANLFIVPIDSSCCWYRYHHLFAELLRHQLQCTQPGLIPLFHRRASHWYEGAGYGAEAIKHALLAADYARAATLLEAMVYPLWQHGAMGTLVSLLKLLPREVLQAHPRLSLAWAWALIWAGPLDAIEEHLQRAEQALPAAPEAAPLYAEVAAIRATVASYQGDVEQTILLGQAALAQLSSAQTFLRATITAALGFAYRVSGRMREAVQTLTEALALGRSVNHRLLIIDALCNLSLVQKMQGRLHQAYAACQEALPLVTDPCGQPLPIAGEVYVILADLLCEWNELTQATTYLQHAFALGEAANNTDILLSCRNVGAKLKDAQGDQTGALAEIHASLHLAQHYKVERIIRHVRASQARLWIAYGDLPAALRWAKELEQTYKDKLDYLRDVEEMSLVRVYLVQGQPDLALNRLATALATARAAGRMGRVIQLLVLQALAYRAKTARAQALVALAEALRLAEPEGYIRTLVDEGEVLRSLLLELPDWLSAQGQPEDAPRLLPYIRTLLAAFPQPAGADTPDPTPSLATPVGSSPMSATLVEPLSQRELEVLQLIGDGLTNQEIARRLTVAMSTVKKHINSIFGKLSVTHRTQAVARARELHLL